MADTTQVAYSPRARNAQEALDLGRHAHMLAIQGAFAAGLPVADIDHGTASFVRAVRRLTTLLTVPSGRAPMFLGAQE